jgi:exodeoxyribonuclease V alpha subunit
MGKATAQTPTTPPAHKTISGVIERITFQNEDTGYTVARLLPDRRDDRAQRDGLVTIVGSLIGVNIGEALELTGFWQHHTAHGWQFTVLNYRSVLPATAQGIRKYLGSGLIKGIGPRIAERIVAHFDVGTLDILDTQPERLREVPGIGAKKITAITEAWREQKAIKDVMIFLQGNGISTSLAVRIYKQYGDASITIAKNEPYRLAREVDGIGFRTADKIAQALGVKPDDPERLKAGTLHALSQATDDGHTYLPIDTLAENAAELLGVSLVRARQAVDDLVLEQGASSEFLKKGDDGSLAFLPAQNPIHKNKLGEGRPAYGVPQAPPDAEQVVYLWPFYRAESNVAKHIQRLMARAPHEDKLREFAGVSIAALLDGLISREGLRLSEKQRAGVTMALQHSVSILTGGPGTGKTTSMRALIRLLQARNKKVALAAPTGRAAKRLSEATGIEAKTLHRLLQLRPGSQAGLDQTEPIDADIIIVDESSMLDILLMNTLLKAVPTGAHVLFVGDADQLPSVGAGNVLADLINSGVVPVTRLDVIFRQSESSAIITNAHRINKGEMPATGGVISDFFVFAEEDAEKAGELVLDLVTRRIPAKFGLKPAEIQVLAPMHNGKCGVSYLNERLQEMLNPPAGSKPQKQFGHRIFRAGDKVLQTRNNYDLDVFNGDAGVITAIYLEEQIVQVRLEDGRVIDYEFTELDQLTLAYAISIHKSQGSEYAAVVIPLVMGHYMMLERKLLYTAVTRAKKLTVLVGSRRAIGMAVRNAGMNKAGRFTGLAIRLRS